MADFVSTTEIEVWLENQSREVISVFSVRAALRAFPTFDHLFRIRSIRPEGPPENLILPCFWAVASALSARTWPDSGFAEASVRNAAIATAVAVHDAHNSAAVNAAHAAIIASDLASDVDGVTRVVRYVYSHDIFVAYSHDRDFIESGGSAKDLVMHTLWADGIIPEGEEISWRRLRDYLLGLDQDWEVWTDWYEDRVKGGIPFIKEIEIGLDPENGDYGRVTFPEEDYKDPAIVNPKIKAVIDNYWARQDVKDNPDVEIPQAKAASVTTVWRNGKIRTDKSRLDADIANQKALANLLALKAELLELAASVKPQDNIDDRPAKFMAVTAGLIIDEMPNSVNLFRLVHREATLLEYEPLVKNHWPDFLAIQYSSLCTQMSEVLDQFADRREFKRHQATVELENINPGEADETIKNSTAVMRSELGQQKIDLEVPDSIDSIDSENLSKEQIGQANQVLIVDKFESTNNVLKALASKALEDDTSKEIMRRIDNQYAQGTLDTVLSGARKAGEEDGERLGKTLARGSAAKNVGEVVGAKLSDRYPKIFGWLNRFE